MFTPSFALGALSAVTVLTVWSWWRYFRMPKTLRRTFADILYMSVAITIIFLLSWATYFWYFAL
jgi:hypothetical protein